MAAAVEETLGGGPQLLVQAGTGTGKSFGYLAPAAARLAENAGERIIVATATLALQAQLASKDVPAVVKATQKVTGRKVSWTLLKGRTNYACLHRVREGGVGDQGTLLGGDDLVSAFKQSSANAASVLGAEVVALREWAESEVENNGLADKDFAPTHSPAAWAQVSVPSRECLGQTCSYFAECFVELSREVARGSQLVITNHALLAINALHGGTALPEHGTVIVDEAHEFAARVTGAASNELSPQLVERVARRCLEWLDDDLGLDFLDSADSLRAGLETAELARIENPESPVIVALAEIRDVSRRVVTALGGDGAEPEQRQAQAAAREIFDIAEQMAKVEPYDVIWVSERERFGRQVVQAPLSVADLVRERILREKETVLTSATLKLGGDFSAVAGQVGLRADDRAEGPGPADEVRSAEVGGPIPWRGLDVGSPFDYARQGILYVAKDLPNPGRDGTAPDTLKEIAELVWAAGGRTLGLFASQRAAEAAAIHCRTELPHLTILCQGEAQLSDLTRRFAAEPAASLFGTLSLWQGIDIPGETCQLVIIDKIPFPRPDEPLFQARQKAVADAGGNGFMRIAASHAALLLAQGSGRLIRRSEDRGVIAVLDPRLVTARYGSFLRATMPDFWMTTDREAAVGALRRLVEQRGPSSKVGAALPAPAAAKTPATKKRQTRRKTATTLPKIDASLPSMGE
ncbi:MAG: ATP-dependent DNA helicase [Micropruina sp.]|nr:ATP-dependent DNA helicase [Micropruina sp.]